MLVYNLIDIEEVDSTNNKANELLENKFLPEGTSVISKFQKKGRGLDKNKWESEKGKNILLSFILYPIFLNPSMQFLLNQIISLSVLDFIKCYLSSENVKIKWPNDIYVDDKKIAGILIENSIQGDIITQSIAGIGINVNQKIFKSNAPNPVSLKNITGEYYDIENCIDRLFLCTAKRYKLLEFGNFTKINDDYINALYKFEVNSFYKYKNQKIEARITGISEYGFLQMLTIENKFIECDLKEIKFLI